MKRFLIFVLCGIFLVGLTGCNDSEIVEEESTEHTFKAVVTKCEENTMIVRPDETEPEHSSSDEFRISLVGDYTTCNVDDRVNITYTGFIAETYPAQVNVTKIELLQ